MARRVGGGEPRGDSRGEAPLRPAPIPALILSLSKDAVLPPFHGGSVHRIVGMTKLESPTSPSGQRAATFLTCVRSGFSESKDLGTLYDFVIGNDIQTLSELRKIF